LARKKYGSGTLIGIAVLVIVVLAIATNGFTKSPLSSTSYGGSTIVGPTTSGFTAYCSGSPATPAGVYPAGPGTTPPAGCGTQAQLLSLTIADLYNTGKSLSASYSCVFFYNVGTPATFTATGPGVSISGGTWAQGPGVQASSTGVCAPANWTPTPGTQVIVKVCIDAGATCVAGDYTAQKTVAYCPLPSTSPTVTLIPGTSAQSQACTPGPGWGSVPFTTLTSASTAPTFYGTANIIMIAGQNPTGSNSGYNTATPVLLDERYQNGTDVTAASQCFVNTGAAACDLPKASSTGRFTMTWGLTEGGAGTAPANPAGSGFMDITPVETQTGPLARGNLQLMLSIEIKATTNNDMCSITSPTLFGVTPTIKAKSNSATDIFYNFLIPDTQITKITDISGLPQNVGAILSTIQLDCSAVYNGSGDVVTITPILYAYYSQSYFNYYNGAQVNPEAVAIQNSAVITIKT
jgi:hypothetical protein